MTEKRQITIQGCGGIGFFGLLTIVLIALKLSGVVSISWFWIVACFFGPWILFLGFLFGVAVMWLVGSVVYKVGVWLFNGSSSRRSRP